MELLSEVGLGGNIARNYRHDLQSFGYVLFYIMGRYRNGKVRPQVEFFRKWSEPDSRGIHRYNDVLAYVNPALDAVGPWGGHASSIDADLPEGLWVAMSQFVATLDDIQSMLRQALMTAAPKDKLAVRATYNSLEVIKMFQHQTLVTDWGGTEHYQHMVEVLLSGQDASDGEEM